VNIGVECLGNGRATGEQSAAADGSDDRVEVRNQFEQLERRR